MIVARVLASRLTLWRHSLFVSGGHGAGLGRGRSPLFVLAILAWMGVLSYQGCGALFAALAAAGAGPAEITGALALALDATALALIVLGLDAAVATLLLDPDLELLRRAPVRPAALLSLKLLDALPRTGAPLVALAIPAALAWSAAVHAGSAAYLAAPVALFLLWALSLGLGIAVALPLLALVPPKRARAALGLTATLVLLGAWLANALWLPRLAAGTDAPLDQARRMIATASAAAPLTPGRAVARALAALAGTASEGGPAGALPAAALALLALALAAASASRFLPRALEAVAAPPPRSAAPRAFRRDGPNPSLLRIVWERDAKLFLRDWTVVTDVLVVGLLWTLLPLLAREALAAGGAALASVMLASLAVGLGYEVAARSVPFERRAATWMQLAPVAATRWIRSKALATLALTLPMIVLAWGLASVSFRLTPAESLGALDTGLSALALSTGLGIWAGTRFGDPKWTNPRGMLTLAGRLTASGLMLVQTALWFAIVLAGPGLLPGAARVILAAALLPASAAIALLPIRSAAGRVPRLGWYG